MKKSILTALAIIIFTQVALSQKYEFSANLNTGFYRHTGSDAGTMTLVTISPDPLDDLYISPGEKSGSSYELSLRGQRVTRQNLIYGVELGYQSLESKSYISGVLPSIFASAIFPAYGSSRINSKFIGITPFIGYRLRIKQVSIDLKGGPEFAPCISRKQKTNATIIGSDMRVDRTRYMTTKHPDFRIRGEATISYKRFGINIGYSHGQNNYFDDEDFGAKAYSRFVRIGLSYRIW